MLQLTRRTVGQRLGHLPSLNLKIQNVRMAPTDKFFKPINDLTHWYEKIKDQKGM